MLENPQMSALKSALKAAEDLRRISSMNIANSETVGYKKLKGYFAPDCECQCFSDILPEVAKRMKSLGYPATPQGHVHLEMVRDQTPGDKVSINGKDYEGSNVDSASEFSNLVNAAAITRSALSAIQLENRIQQEILNIGG
ncbi:MAG TPA: hypothetical protein V6C96_05505 [Vampirovibrionales bacterium]